MPEHELHELLTLKITIAMLYYQFNGYEGFKEIFGIQEHGNGVKSRRNKILLALLTSREFVNAVRTTTWNKGQRTVRAFMERFYALKSMADMRQLVLDAMHTEVYPLGNQDGYTTDCYLLYDKEQRGCLYRLKSMQYEVMDGGLCFDGDFKAVRYRNRENDKIYKMKAGKFMRRLIDENPFGAILPEQVKVWMCEDFTERWIAYARGKCTGFHLHVGGELEDFETIYDDDNYAGSFGSCMAGEGQYEFYYNAVSARAAWLTNGDEQVVARCVIFTEVRDADGNRYRLAERQYSSEGDNALKRMLVDKLIEAGEIDGYKQVGVDCHNSRAYVSNSGEDWSDKHFHIHCSLSEGDTLSYQDSFKYYDYENDTAYNWRSDAGSGCEDLATTNSEFERANNHDGEVYSDHYDGWIDRNDATYASHRDDYFYDTECHYCENTGTWEYEDDCVEMGNGDYAYYGRYCNGYDGVYRCPECEEYYLKEDNCYSEITGEDYCCETCRHEAEQRYMERYADRDGYLYDDVEGEWFDPRKEKAVRVLLWDYNTRRRINGVTREQVRKDGCDLYGSNWYYSHMHLHEGEYIPAERYEKMLPADVQEILEAA